MDRSDIARRTEQRATPRYDVYLDTHLKWPDGTRSRVELVNLSALGFMVRCDRTVAVGERATISISDIGPVEGEVVWSLGGRIGFKLLKTIPLAAFLRALPKLQQAALHR